MSEYLVTFLMQRKSRYEHKMHQIGLTKLDDPLLNGEGGYVDACYVNDTGEHIIIKANLNRPQALSKNPHEVWVSLLKSNGAVVTGHCTCITGTFPFCIPLPSCFLQHHPCSISFIQQHLQAALVCH
ncbi:hypothetical protein ACJMK2_002563 [Sinanodonta woodiana]|uniref:Uncharacterized protein n=1 Tax=Sinanodonta woodiana TaxID=1069815 RepID=A0ABD3XWB2_SINWO